MSRRETARTLEACIRQRNWSITPGLTAHAGSLVEDVLPRRASVTGEPVRGGIESGRTGRAVLGGVMHGDDSGKVIVESAGRTQRAIG